MIFTLSALFLAAAEEVTDASGWLSDIPSGVYVLAGALLGAGTTVIADFARSKRDDRGRLLGARRAAYADYLALLDDTSDLFGGLHEARDEKGRVSEDERGIILYKFEGEQDEREVPTAHRLDPATFRANAARANACLAVMDLLGSPNVGDLAASAWGVSHRNLDDPKRDKAMVPLINAMRVDVGLPGNVKSSLVPAGVSP